jgi:hypothetical protein
MFLQLLNNKNGKHNVLVRNCKVVEILKEAGKGLKDRHFMLVASLKYMIILSCTSANYVIKL